MREQVEVSEGSVFSYSTPQGTRWRWQAVAVVRSGRKVVRKKRLGDAGHLSEKAAQEARAIGRFLVEKDGVPDEPTPIAPEHLLAEVCTQWLNSLDLAAATVAGYRSKLANHVVPYLGEMPVADITPDDLNDLYEALRTQGRKDVLHHGDPLKLNSISKVQQNLEQVLEYARRRRWVDVNVARDDSIVKPSTAGIRAETEEITVWTIDEVKLVLDWNEKKYRDDLHALWFLIAKTGLRRGEALAIQWRDIDFQARTLRVMRAADSARSKQVKPTKSYRSRPINLSDDVIRHLVEHRRLREQLGKQFVAGNAWVFGTSQNELRGPNDVTRRWSKFLARVIEAHPELALPPVTIHGLRHSHATHLLQLGVHPKVVQERLGHANINITLELYSHVSPTIQSEAVGRLDAAWGEL